MCTLHDSPVIACNNQLSAIQALRQVIQWWFHPTLPSSIQVVQVPPPPPTPKQSHSILRPMRRQAPFQPSASLPRVFFLMHKAAPSAPSVTSSQGKDELFAQHTRSRITHTVDPPPQRVDKATYPGPIACHTRSQTISMDNIITPSQAA